MVAKALPHEAMRNGSVYNVKYLPPCWWDPARWPAATDMVEMNRFVNYAVTYEGAAAGQAGKAYPIRRAARLDLLVPQDTHFFEIYF